MVQASPYREDGKDRGPKPPSQREQFILEMLEKRFGVKDPQRWIVAQAEADHPDERGWEAIFGKAAQSFALDDDKCRILLRKFAHRVLDTDLLTVTAESTTYLLMCQLVMSESEIYDADGGYYWLSQNSTKVFKLQQGSRDNSSSCNVYSSADFTPQDFWMLVSASIFWAWNGNDKSKAAEARPCVCEPLAEAIAEAVHKAGEEYERMTVLGSQRYFPSYPGIKLQDVGDAEKINCVVVWDRVADKYVAWLFDGAIFTPDSFTDPRPVTLESSAQNIDERLRGTTGRWPFKTRTLQQDLNFLWIYNQRLAVMACCMNQPGGPALPFEKILYAHVSRLKGDIPQGGEKLL